MSVQARNQSQGAIGGRNALSEPARTLAANAVGGGNGRKVLIIVENLPVPFDRRVWQEALALREAGYQVAVICPTGKGCTERHERLEGIGIFRYRAPLEAASAAGYLVEYGVSLVWQFVLSLRVLRRHGFDVIHACNPPDTIFLIGLFYKALGKSFLFDHHDINPELFEAKFGRRGFLYKVLLGLERLTFATADVSIATNASYRDIAIERGRMPPDRVFIVRSGPDLMRLSIVPPDESLKQGRRFLVGYVGVMGEQEGIDYLLRAIRYIVYERGRTDVHFGLVGGGTSLEAMKRYAESLGVSDYVTFTGRVSDSELLAVLNTADVCVNPDIANTMNDKSTMNKIMEYMALGKPIVQFEMTKGRVSAQDASLYAARNDEHDLADKIVALLDDPEQRDAMGQIGRKRVETQLAWKYQIPNLLAAYDRIFALREGFRTE